MQKNYKRFKKYRKPILKEVAKYNKQIGDRYIIRESFQLFSPFDDGSGGHAYVWLEISDKESPSVGEFLIDNFNYKWRIFDFVNDFVCRCECGRPGHYPPLPWASLFLEKT